MNLVVNSMYMNIQFFLILSDRAHLLAYHCLSSKVNTSVHSIGECRSANCKCTAPPSIVVKSTPPNNLSNVIKCRRPC